VIVPRLAAVLLLGLSSVARGEPPAGPLEVRVERAADSPLRGRLVALDTETVSVAAGDRTSHTPVAAVRRVVGEPAERIPAPAVRVVLTDGGTLTGGDFVQEGEQAVVSIPAGRIVLPLERVQSVAWLAANADEPAWRGSLPGRPAADLVVIRREAGHEFVECAVTGVTAEHVTVVLDGETIPVRRTKVAGIEWLRERTAPPGGTVVQVAGGRLEAREVVWSPAGLVLDGDIRLPASLLRSIDYAAGRSVPLVSLTPERSEVEPFFGGLTSVAGLAGFFAPRPLPEPAADGPGTLLLRPRTVLTWRIPADSRRLRGTVARDLPAASQAGVELVISVDDREVFRRRLDAAAAATGPLDIDCDVSGGRRLNLAVDFVPGDLGCGVRLSAAAFEK